VAVMRTPAVWHVSGPRQSITHFRSLSVGVADPGRRATRPAGVRRLERSASDTLSDGRGQRVPAVP
jgi:hypothetical protein